MWQLAGSIFFGWGLGANDTANIFGPSVTSGIVKYRLAIILTSIFLFLGAIIEGPKCMGTVSAISVLTKHTAFFCILSSAIILFILTFLGIPASSSQAVIGAVTGIGILNGAADLSKLLKVFVCWILTPVGAIFFTILFYYLFAIILDKFFSNIYHRNNFLLWAVLIAGSYGAYSLGANNTANITGVYVGSGLLSPFAASLIGGASIVLGVMTYSYKVMATIGNKIVPLDPFPAFIVTLSNASVVHIFTQLSVPVSSSQAIVGAIIGIGIVKGFRTVSKKMVGSIVLSWFLTPVLSGVLAYLFVIF